MKSLPIRYYHFNNLSKVIILLQLLLSLSLFATQKTHTGKNHYVQILAAAAQEDADKDEEGAVSRQKEQEQQHEEVDSGGYRMKDIISETASTTNTNLEDEGRRIIDFIDSLKDVKNDDKDETSGSSTASSSLSTATETTSTAATHDNEFRTASSKVAELTDADDDDDDFEDDFDDDDDDDDDDDAIDNNNINNARKLLAPLLTSPLLTTGKMVLGYIKCGPYCVVGLKSFHSKYPGVMTWTVNTKEPDAAVKFSHPRDALGAYLDSITKNDNADDDDDDEENKKTASLIEAVLELADPEELHHSLPFVTIGLPEENQDENANVNVNANGTTGWGGTGRVTLIGDAAHAMRSAGGQGGAMAFEDCVVLARILEQTQALSGGNANDNDKDSDNDTVDDVHHTRASIETAVLEFENSRLPRVRTIWNDQWERAERAYKGDFKPSRTEEDELKYQAWVDKGV